MNEYTFDIGFQDVTITASSEKEAWRKIEQFAPEGQPIRLINVKTLV